ncbi:translation initiation factor IF-2-like [Dermacentor silvarum]|uniref:translation initiation factor IF-2-like n=1 Tax=Dermacentor silvarum TaxID=543639 RepID=UPI00189AFC06|nr:translation initiation factor IF-2-like [Dermacentor silvarum]
MGAITLLSQQLDDIVSATSGFSLAAFPSPVASELPEFHGFENDPILWLQAAKALGAFHAWPDNTIWLFAAGATSRYRQGMGNYEAAAPRRSTPPIAAIALAPGSVSYTRPQGRHHKTAPTVGRAAARSHYRTRGAAAAPRYPPVPSSNQSQHPMVAAAVAVAIPQPRLPPPETTTGKRQRPLTRAIHHHGRPPPGTPSPHPPGPSPSSAASTKAARRSPRVSAAPKAQRPPQRSAAPEWLRPSPPATQSTTTRGQPPKIPL